jgi:hypothetical protein
MTRKLTYATGAIAVLAMSAIGTSAALAKVRPTVHFHAPIVSPLSAPKVTKQKPGSQEINNFNWATQNHTVIGGHSAGSGAGRGFNNPYSK